MPIPTPPLQGGCLCGAVKIETSEPPLLTLVCHCRGCQKLTASAFSLTTMFPSAGFSHTGELIIGGLGTKGRRHYFCKSCLNFVFSRIAGAESRVNLRTSLLDDTARFEPFVEVMTEEKLPWAHVPAQHSFSRFPESPETLQALMDEYAKL